MPIPVERQNKARRKGILQAALKLFIEKGYFNTSLRDIINLSSVGTGTFYNYFIDKEDVLQSLLEDFAEEIISGISGYYLKEPNLYARFIETKRLTMELFAQNKDMSKLYCRVVGAGDRIEQCLQQFDDKLIKFYSRNLEYGIKKGIFKDIPVSPIAHSILAMEKYMLYQWVVLETVNKEEMIDMVVSFHQTMAVGLLFHNV